MKDINDFINHYLAKSNPIQTIIEHTEELLKNLEILKEVYPNLFKGWDRLYILKLACLYHDLGKMNVSFQKMIMGKRGEKQIPHGVLSLAFLDCKDLREKLKERYIKDGMLEEKAENIAMWEIRVLAESIGYHHDREFNYSEDELVKAIEELKNEIKDFNYFRLDIKKVKKISTRYFNENERIQLQDNPDMFFEYIIVKGLLNRLDYAASAGIDVEIKNNFLMDSLENLLKDWKKNSPNVSWNELQKFALENSDKNIIAVAQTGMGKTEAGLLWIGDNKGFFILPLKTAINSIYDRVVNGIVKDKALIQNIGLLHSETTEKYLNFIENDDNYENIDFDTYYTSTKQLCLPLTICTLDQIFDFVYRYRGFEPKLATLSYSKIVLDEIQMYSPDLLAYVIMGLSLMTKLGGKFAIVTATLPPIIVNLLKREGIDFVRSEHFTKENLQVRHSIKVVENLISSDEGIEKIISNYNKNKILVICNTVKEAQNVAEKLKKKLGNRINIFHSKFIKRDRALKEKMILKLGDKKNKDYGIWITTQVVEASLDIDFDILFTELSDLSGLFQRMGRCYRNRSWDKEGYNCYVFIGKDEEKNTGIGKGLKGVVDESIYELSKKTVKKKFGGIINEKEKMKYIEDLYTMDNLKETEYFKKVEDTIKYLNFIYPYEKSKNEIQKLFRNIRSTTIIPENIYNENIDKINYYIEILNKNYSKNMSTEEKLELRKEKINAKKDLYDFTMSIQGYEMAATAGKYFKDLSKIEIGKNEIIYILDCVYDDYSGFKIKKHDEMESYLEVENMF